MLVGRTYPSRILVLLVLMLPMKNSALPAVGSRDLSGNEIRRLITATTAPYHPAALPVITLSIFVDDCPVNIVLNLPEVFAWVVILSVTQ